MISDGWQAMLEAHVRFELDRWSDDGVQDTVHQEVAAVLGRLGVYRLDELLDPSEITDAVLPVVTGEALAGEFGAMVAEGVQVVHQLMAGHEARIDELVDEVSYTQVVEAVVGMRHARREVIQQITTSSVYGELIAHVLYHGIKDYLVTQNALARKIPGASSMLRLGQSAMSAAAPGLERSIDRQLTAFITANVAETVRGSSEFLARVLDDDMIRTVGAELWATNAQRRVAEMAALLSEPSAAEALDAGRELWEDLRGSELVADAVTAAVDGIFEAYGDRTVETLLGDLGITAEALAGHLVAATLPFVRALRSSGVLEERIRARLGAFYSTWPQEG